MRIILLFFGAAIFLGACSTSQYQQEQQIQETIKARDNIGKTFWVTLRLRVCDAPNVRDADAKCEYIEKGKFVVQDVEGEVVRTVGIPPKPILPPGLVYRLAFEDSGRIGYIQERDLIKATNNDVVVASAKKDAADAAAKKAAAAECKRRGEPRIGMTVEQVIATCWGKPHHVNRTQSVSGTSDQYVYPGNRYLYFRDGVLMSMQVSGTVR
jgi:hypothetical protein